MSNPTKPALFALISEEPTGFKLLPGGYFVCPPDAAAELVIALARSQGATSFENLVLAASAAGDDIHELLGPDGEHIGWYAGDGVDPLEWSPSLEGNTAYAVVSLPRPGQFANVYISRE